MRFSLSLAICLSVAVHAAAQQDTLVIHFDFDRHFIRPADTARLDSLARTTGIASLTLAGHTDNKGSDRYNDSLSLLRAYAAQRYLLSKGLPDSLFKSIGGYGSRRPYDPADAASNRRVEIVVVPNSSRPEAPIQPPSITPTPSTPTLPPASLPSLGEAFSDTAHLAGKSFILHNVNFYGDRHIPLPEAYPELNQLLTVMRQYPRMIIQIQGYVCCMRDDFDGRDADIPSQPLSVQRAKFVYDFLAGGGIKRSRMSYKGFGASNKIFPEERTDEERKANRRVEIKVISF